MTEYTYGEETPWGGGKCPVDKDALVSVNLRGTDRWSVHWAWALRWHHNLGPADIVAYRIATPINEAQEAQIARLRSALSHIVNVHDIIGDGKTDGPAAGAAMHEAVRIAREALHGDRE